LRVMYLRWPGIDGLSVVEGASGISEICPLNEFNIDYKVFSVYTSKSSIILFAQAVPHQKQSGFH